MAFSIYKPGQGKYTRLCSAFGAAVVVALGCLQLYRKLQATELGLWVQTMVPVAIFVALGIVIYLLVARKHSIVDFMIAAEGEMKKVSWSGRKEIAVSTFIVIVVVIVVAMLLGVTDFGFELFFMWLLG
ncbi:MAG: preprotein translocase subunit SecE [Planctomycetota bacterium]|jgi:preprotein translocase SecE subunit